jgi:hypothetical protein
LASLVNRYAFFYGSVDESPDGETAAQIQNQRGARATSALPGQLVAPGRTDQSETAAHGCADADSFAEWISPQFLDALNFRTRDADWSAPTILGNERLPVNVLESDPGLALEIVENE